MLIRIITNMKKQTIKNYFGPKPFNHPSNHWFSTTRKTPQMLEDSTQSPSPRLKGSPFIVGIAGGTASGKTEVVKRIIGSLSSVAVIPQDSFYIKLSPEQKALAQSSKFNFDHPFAFDFNSLIVLLKKMRHGHQVRVPSYDYINHQSFPTNSDTIIENPTIVILEGILALHDPLVRELCDMKLFVDADADTRLIRRIRRDISERGRNLEKTLEQYETFVKPSFDTFCLPQKVHADVIIPRGVENTVAISLIVKNLRAMQLDCLQERQKDIEKKSINLK